MSDFKGRRFPTDIILVCVRWYCKYGISYRDLEEMMSERGVKVDHTRRSLRLTARQCNKAGVGQPVRVPGAGQSPLQVCLRLYWYRATANQLPKTQSSHEFDMPLVPRRLYLPPTPSRRGDLGFCPRLAGESDEEVANCLI
jgi:hypothetical protein